MVSLEAEQTETERRNKHTTRVQIHSPCTADTRYLFVAGCRTANATRSSSRRAEQQQQHRTWREYIYQAQNAMILVCRLIAIKTTRRPPRSSQHHISRHQRRDPGSKHIHRQSKQSLAHRQDARETRHDAMPPVVVSVVAGGRRERAGCGSRRRVRFRPAPLLPHLQLQRRRFFSRLFRRGGAQGTAENKTKRVGSMRLLLLLLLHFALLLMIRVDQHPPPGYRERLVE